MTALLKFTQDATVGGNGHALLGNLSNPFQIANSDNTGIGSWEIQILEVPYGSAVTKGVLAQANSNTPAGSFAPDVSGGCWRIQLRTWPQANRQGTPDTDIRCVGVIGSNALLAPPPQVWPLPLPHPSSGRPGAKPNELNFGGQDGGWAGQGDDGLLRHAIRLIGEGGGSNPYARAAAQLQFAITSSVSPPEVSDATQLAIIPAPSPGGIYQIIGPGVDDGFFALLPEGGAEFGLQYVSDVPGDVWVRVTTSVTLKGSNAGDAKIWLGINMQGTVDDGDPGVPGVTATYVPQITDAEITVTFVQYLAGNNTSNSKLILTGMRTAYGSITITKVHMTAEVMCSLA